MPMNDSDQIQELETKVEENTGINPSAVEYYPDLVLPSQKPLGIVPASVYRPEAKDRKKPEFSETLYASFRQYNLPYNAYQWATDNRDRLTVEEGFDPIKEKLLDGVPEEYHSTILQYGNRYDAVKTREKIFKEIGDRETIEKSGWLASNVAMLGANLLDPTNLLIATQTLKYANVAKSAYMGAWNTAKSMSPVIAMQNAVIYGAKETEGLKDWAMATLTESVFASAIGGVLGAYAGKNIVSQKANAEAFLKSSDLGIDIKHVVNEKGVWEKNIAVVQPGSNVSAMQVENIQQLLDVGHVAFKDSPFIRSVMGLGSPIVRGVTSEFPMVREFISKVFPHAFELAGGVADSITDPSAMQFVKHWRGMQASTMIDVRQDWMDSLNIKGPGRGIRSTIGEWSGQFESFTKYKEEVTKAIRRGNQHENPYVARSAKKMHEKVFIPLLEEIKRVNPAFKEHTATNIINWMMRIYDKPKITGNPQGFLDFVTNELAVQNQKITAYQAPIQNVTKQKNGVDLAIKDLQDKMKGGDYKILSKKEKELEKVIKNLEKSQDSTELLNRRQVLEEEISKLDKVKENFSRFQAEFDELKVKSAGFKEEIVRLQAELNEKIKLGEVELDLLDGKLDFTPEQLKQLEEFRKPIQDAEKKLELAKEKGNKKEISQSKKLLKEAKESFIKKVEKGEIPEELYRLTAKGAKLHDPNQLPSLRRLLNESEISNLSISIRNNILQQNEEQLAGQIFGGIQKGSNNPFKERVLMFNDSKLEPWVVNDIDQISGLYSDQVSKRIYMDEVLKNYGGTPDKGIEGFISHFKGEYDGMVAKVLKEAPSPEREKKLLKLDDDFQKTNAYLRDMYKVYFGNYNDRSSIASRVASSVNKFGVWTMLGAVPILMMTEFATPLFRYTFKNYIGDGLMGALNRFQSWGKNFIAKEGELAQTYVKGQFADANLCLNRYISTKFQALGGYGKDYGPKNFVEKTIDFLATASQSISGANYVMDLQEFMAGSMADASFIRTIKKYNAGEKLLKAEIDQLDRARINPAKWGQKIESQFNIHGKPVDGSYVSNFHLWDDLETARIYSMGINHDVRQILLLPDPTSKPLMLQNPVASMIGQFTSYIFEASNKFTIPLMTTPDSTKFTGVIGMMAISSMIGPLRQLSRGEDPDMDIKTLMNEAITNSALLGWHFDLGMKANAYLDLPALRFLQPDRFKRKSSGALSLGPASSLLDSLFNFTSALANGEMNEQDTKKGMRLAMGGTYNWYTAKLINDALSSLNLPKNRYEAKKLNELAQ